MEKTHLILYRFLGLERTSKTTGFPRVLMLLSSLLERSVKRDELLVEAADFKDTITVFHGLRAPTLSIKEYIDRIFKYAGCSPSCFVVAFIYVDRFIRCTKSVQQCILCLSGRNEDSRIEQIGVEVSDSIDFRLQSVESLDRYCVQLKREAEEEGIQIRRPIKSCGVKESWSSKDDSSCTPTVAG